MGKKGTWFSAIKRLFTCCYINKDKPVNVLHKKSWKGKGLGRLKHIPLFREPSSIEKILGEIEHHNLTIHHPTPAAHPPSSSRPNVIHTPQPSLQKQHLSATRIQSVYRGYMARRNVRGLVRLQRVINSKNVKRQRVNAMKQMQLLVRVQTQVHSGRIQSQTLTPQSNNNSPNKQSEMGEEYWDDSLITKEEREARLKRKVEAGINRERAMSYAYSHQIQKASAHHQTSLMGGYHYPWWWNRAQPPPKNQTTTSRSTTPPRKQLDTPSRPMSSRSMVSSSTPPNKYSKARSRYPLKDDASLMSCPPFSVPNYMSPTVSARAKAKTPTSYTSRRRFSFPFTPNKSPGSIGDLSIDSATSVPSSVRRKPFNRFV